MKTVAFLMNDAPDNPACLYSNLESAKSTLWRNYRYPGYLRNALESAEILNRNGAEISVSLEDLKGALRKREEFASYIAEAEEKANEGELMDDLRDLIDGFDLIAHGNMGSFHDSELLSILIDHEANHIELKLHMCNGSDEILEVRLNITYMATVTAGVNIYMADTSTASTIESILTLIHLAKSQLTISA